MFLRVLKSLKSYANSIVTVISNKYIWILSFCVVCVLGFSRTDECSICVNLRKQQWQQKWSVWCGWCADWLLSIYLTANQNEWKFVWHCLCQINDRCMWCGVAVLIVASLRTSVRSSDSLICGVELKWLSDVINHKRLRQVLLGCETPEKCSHWTQ